MKKSRATKNGLIKFCNELDEMKLMCDEAMWVTEFLVAASFSFSLSSSRFLSLSSSSSFSCVAARKPKRNEMHCAICIATSTIRCTLPLYSLLCIRIDFGLALGMVHCIGRTEKYKVRFIESIGLQIYSLAALSLPILRFFFTPYVCYFSGWE